MAAIGYHFGAKDALMTAALIDAIGSGDAFDNTADGPVPPKKLWAALIESFDANKTFWIANLEAILQAQRDPDIRAALLNGIGHGRSGMAHTLTGQPESELSTDTVRTLGSVQMALISGLMMQRLVDPDNSPEPAEIISGIKRLAELS